MPNAIYYIFIYNQIILVFLNIFDIFVCFSWHDLLITWFEIMSLLDYFLNRLVILLEFLFIFSDV